MLPRQHKYLIHLWIILFYMCRAVWDVKKIDYLLKSVFSQHNNLLFFVSLAADSFKQKMNYNFLQTNLKKFNLNLVFKECF